MPSRSPSAPRSRSRGRSLTRSRTPASAMDRSKSRSLRRTISPRGSEAARGDGVSGRNGERAPARTRSRSPMRSRSRSRSRSGYRARSYSRSPARSASPAMPRSSKVGERSGASIILRTCCTDTNFQVVIEKLTKNVHEGHLREIFGTYGSIQELDMPMNRQCTFFFPSLPFLPPHISSLRLSKNSQTDKTSH